MVAEESHAQRLAAPFGIASEATLHEKKAGRLPGAFFLVFRHTPKNLELLIDREPEIALNEAGAARRVKVCNDVVHG